nr:hypothetical protein L204_03623 [Cryptococcus depauperatus CBS 7855]
MDAVNAGLPVTSNDAMLEKALSFTTQGFFQAPSRTNVYIAKHQQDISTHIHLLSVYNLAAFNVDILQEGSTQRRGPGRPKGSRNKKKPTVAGSSSLSRLEGEATSSQRSEMPSQYERSTQRLAPTLMGSNPTYNPFEWSNEQDADTSKRNTGSKAPKDRKTRKPHPDDWDSKRGGTIQCSNEDETEAEDPNSGAYPDHYDPALLGMLDHDFTQNTNPLDLSVAMDPNQPSLEYYQYDPNQQESADLTQYDPEFSFNGVPWNPNYLPEQ